MSSKGRGVADLQVERLKIKIGSGRIHHITSYRLGDIRGRKIFYRRVKAEGERARSRDARGKRMRYLASLVLGVWVKKDRGRKQKIVATTSTTGERRRLNAYQWKLVI